MRIKRAFCRFYLGDVLDCFAQPTRLPYAGLEIPNRAYQPLNATDQRLRFDDYLDGGNGGGTLSEIADFPDPMQGMILACNPFNFMNSMSLDMVTNSAGLGVCVPKNHMALHLLSYDNTANRATSYTSRGALPAQPCFALYLTRAAAPPHGMCELIPNSNPPAFSPDQIWRLTFGGRYTLEFSRMTPACLYRDYGTPQQEVIARRPRSDVKGSTYGWLAQFQISVFNVSGNLYFLSDLWGGTWLVKLYDDTKPEGRNKGVNLPQATWSLTCTGGKYAFNLLPFVFSDSGYVETDWVSLPSGNTYPDTAYPTDPNGCQVRYWPPAPDGATVSGEVVDSEDVDVNGDAVTDYQKKRFKLTIYTNNTTVSRPVVWAWQYQWAPTFSTPAPYWLDITDWVEMEEPPVESKTADPSPHTLELTLTPTVEHGGMTLWQALQAQFGELQGAYAFKYEVGVVYDDDTTDQETRLTGFLEMTGKSREIEKLDSVRLTAVDRWYQLNTAMMYPPSVAGLRVDTGISQLANWAGIPSVDIDAEAIPFVLDTQESTTEFSGQLPWTPPAGTKAADTIREICQTYGVAVWFNGNGRMQIRQRRMPTAAAVVASYSAEDGASESVALSSWSEEQPRNDLYNFLVVEGVGPDGKPIYATAFDYDSIYMPHSPRYLGQIVTSWHRKPDIMSEGNLTVACRQLFDWRPGMISYKLASSSTEMWKRWPHDIVLYTDPDGTEHVLYLLTVGDKLGPLLDPSIEGEERA